RQRILPRGQRIRSAAASDREIIKKGFQTSKSREVLREWMKRKRKRKESASTNRKGCDFGYAPAVSSCEGVHSVDTCTVAAPDVTTAFAVQTPTAPRWAVGFFGSGGPPGHPFGLVTQPTSDWPPIICANPSYRRT